MPDMIQTPEEIASSIVEKLNFSSNRMLNGRLVGEQCFAANAIADAIRNERQAGFTQKQIERGADALRRHEMSGRKLNDWNSISAAQRKKWIEKAKVVMEGFDA